jgi:hypothetical protein
MALESTQSHTEMSTTNLPGGEGWSPSVNLSSKQKWKPQCLTSSMYEPPELVIGIILPHFIIIIDLSGKHK